MPYRPLASHRRNVTGVIFPLTEAIRRKYGARASDGAYPLGAFYSVNVSRKAWTHAGGIWYVPISEMDLGLRKMSTSSVSAFIASIDSGEPVRLASGKLISWEEIPRDEAEQLP